MLQTSMTESASVSSRWRRRGLRPAAASLLALLVLGLVSATQAAPARDYSTKIYMWVRRGSDRTICVGDRVAVLATAVQAYEIVGEGPRLANLFGVELEAAVADPSIGTVTPAALTTSVAADVPGQARLTFLATKVGATTLTVNGTIESKRLLGVVLSSNVVTGQIPITVEQCEYRVNAVAVWNLEDITLTAYIENGPLVADPGGDGHYAGNAEVKWIGATVYDPPCYVAHHPAPSRAYITGEKIGDNLLEVKIVYEPTPALFANLVCPEDNVPLFAGQMLGPGDLRVWVPATGGGAERQPLLSGVKIESSSAVILVRPVPAGGG
jgi:hypothetical protein